MPHFCGKGSAYIKEERSFGGSHRFLATRLAGFSLIELLLVIIILSILASIVVPAINTSSFEAKVSGAKSAIKTVQKQLDIYKARNGSYPTELDPAWFLGYKLPVNPFTADSALKSNIRSINDGERWHPVNKYFPISADKAFWYNSANGVFRMVVIDQGNNSATLALYNEVNMTNAGSLSQETW